MKSDTTTIYDLPSGARILIDDPDGKLQECFCQLFGSREAGVAVIADQAFKTRQDKKEVQTCKT